MVISNKRKKISLTALSLAAVIIAGALSYIHQDNSNAADLRRFDPGNIISDAVMANKTTMSVAQIQRFLESKNSCDNTKTYMASWYPSLRYHIKDGKFVCMAKESFNGESAAQIIWQAAQDYGVNPQVLIVLLEKEQGLVTDTWPNSTQYSSATGYNCPDDDAGCRVHGSGFKSQIRGAAMLFSEVLQNRDLDGDYFISNYPVGRNYVQYNPNVACGGTMVTIQNRATSALYRYTPYQPNPSSLNAGYGTGDSCGAYGNRNFWLWFTDWFGSTQSNIQIDMTTAEDGLDSVYDTYRTQLGLPTTYVIPEYTAPIRVWQNFQGGTIIWTQKYGAHVVLSGDINGRWRKLGGSAGTLGVPKNNPVKESSDGRTWQDFDKGTIIYSQATGAWEVLPGPLGDKWRATGGSLGTLGKPTSSVAADSTLRKQTFEKGVTARSNLNAPAYAISGKIYDLWKNSVDVLSAPSTDAVTESNDGRTWQNFKKGTVIDNGSSVYIVRYGAINNAWRASGGSLGSLGKPTANQVTESDGRTWQNFKKGVIIQKNSKSPAYGIEFGPIYNRWRAVGGSIGTLGAPRSRQQTESDGRTWQDFETGTVISASSTGTWEVVEGFYTFWRQHGGSLGSLGKPTSARTIEHDNTRWQTFEKGKAIWSPKTGWSIQKIN